MIYAVLKTMALRLWRDKGALILAFILPGVIFAVFAAIFSTASGGTLDLRVAFAIEGDKSAVSEFAEYVQNNAGFDIVTEPKWNGDNVIKSVRLGEADVGLIMSPGNTPFPQLTIIQDPSRKVAATVVKGQIRQMLADYNSDPTESGAQDIFSTQSAMAHNEGDAAEGDKSVTYYIGATAILFLMFAAMQGASISIDERQSGLAERLMVGQTGALLMLSGKFIFLTVIGFLQAVVVIGVAALFFEVSTLPFIGPLTLASLGTAMLSASLALFVASLCNSQSQMHTVSTFIVLIFSAIGGSMIPRFMMPGWLQDIGVITPNYWAIEGFYGILARGQSVSSLWTVWSVMFGGALLLLVAAAMISHKLMRV